MSEAKYLYERFGAALNNPLFEQLRRHLQAGNYAITSPFGRRINPITKKEEFHNGIDLAPRTKEAWELGLSGYDEIALLPNPEAAGGLSVLLRYGSLRVGMAHLAGLWSVGRRAWRVRIGNTGASTGPHLHLTISYTAAERPELGAVAQWSVDDPMRYLKL